MPVNPTSEMLTYEQFQAEADALADEFIAVLNGRTRRTTVVLQALMQVHRESADQLPPDMRANVYAALADHAIEQAFTAASTPTTH